MILYSRPNFRYFEILKNLFGDDSKLELNIENRIKEITKKKYCLIVDSCKSALYFGYKALKKDGNVIISPLTCKTSILPLIAAGKEPKYCDVNSKTFNIDHSIIEKCIDKNTIALQVINLGGNIENLEKIRKICDLKKIKMIEDCAHSLGGKFGSEWAGSFGDIACFSFMKNISGIGGGAIATNDRNVYEFAKNEYLKIKNVKPILKTYRIVNLIFQNLKNERLKENALLFLRLLRDKKLEQNVRDPKWLIEKMSRISTIEMKIVNQQLDELKINILKRKTVLDMYKKYLGNIEKLVFQETETRGENICTKLFIILPNEAKIIIEKLNALGIEARHLENIHVDVFQDRIDKNMLLYNQSIHNCKKYLKIHDRLISLPISPGIEYKEVKNVCHYLRKEIKQTTIK